MLLFVLIGLGALFLLLSANFLSWRYIFKTTLKDARKECFDFLGYILLSVSLIVMAAMSTPLGSMTALLGVAAGVLLEQLGWPWYAGVAATSRSGLYAAP